MVQLPCVSIVKGATKGSIFRLLWWEVPHVQKNMLFEMVGWCGVGYWFFLLGEVWGLDVRTSPPVLSMWLQLEKKNLKKSKCAGLAQEIGFSPLNSCSLLWLVKGATQLCTSREDCNKLDLTAVQYFWMVDHNGWSRWFAVSSSHVYAVLRAVLLVWLPIKRRR